MSKLVLGLDIGIASVGWGLLEKDLDDNFKRIVDLGVLTFSKMEDKDGKLENAKRREKRSMRRQRRRKVLRKKDIGKLLNSYFNIDFHSLNYSKYSNVYELKVKGLNEQLSKEEMSIVLYHYVKYRGFQSTRKVDDAKSDGKILSAIEELKNSLNGKTVSQVLLDRFNSLPKESRRMHNTDTEYIFTVSRDMYIDEINQLFENQIKLGVCDSSFQEKFMNIYNRRRDFSEGPGSGSKFGTDGSFIEKMIGICKYDNNLRAPRDSYSAQSFVLLSFLNNFTFKENIEERNYKKLSKDQINDIYKYALTKEKITYKDILKIAKINYYRIKGLELSKKQYSAAKKKYIDSYKEKDNSFEFENNDNFKEYLNKTLLDTAIPVGMKFFCTLNKAFTKALKENKDLKNCIESFKNNTDNYDIVAKCLLINKTDEKVNKYLIENGIDDNIIKIVNTLPSISKTINLSLELSKSLIPHLLEGNDYEKSMSKLGYVTNTLYSNIEKHQYLPEITKALDDLDIVLTNANVKHTLVQVRKLINEVIKKYGEIDCYSIEFARELKKSFEQRRENSNLIKDNKYKNDNIKLELVRKYPNIFNNISSPKKDDVIKFKLFKEQKGLCAYTAIMINEKDLFNNNYYQIDHILPYSRSYDDSYTNKVLVTTESNQLKGNRTPKEAKDVISLDNINKVINNSSIGNAKKDKLLANEISDDFIERNIVDTSYIAKLTRTLITAYLQPNKCLCPNGSITSKLKFMWRLNGYTHSYINKNYFNRNTYLIDNFELTPTKIIVNLVVEETNSKESIEIVVKNKDKEKNQTEKLNNKMVETLSSQQSRTESLFNKYKGKSINFLFESCKFESNDLNNEHYNDNLLILLNILKSSIEDFRVTKDRSNHLHHAVDALVTACANEKLVKRVTEYFIDENNNMIIDELTGERRHNFEKFPLPYKEFKDESIIRVYERDKNILLQKLNSLEMYNNTLERRDVKVLYPVRVKDIYKAGEFTKDTKYGMRNNVVTKRLSVLELKEKDVNNIVGSTKQNPIIQACLDWFALGENKPLYPMHPTRNNPIKSVLIEETTNPQSRVKLKEKENIFASNSNVIAVHIYQRYDEMSKLYFVPIYYYQTVSNKKDDINYQIMWGQGNNFDYIKGKDLETKYHLLANLPRFSLIEIEMVSGAKGICYSGGVSSGLFEIYSILGDGLDIVQNNLISSVRPQFQLTCSTIKSIKVRSLSLLGDLN